MEATESIIRKIEKCLALSKSSNEGEAAAALRQATKLMELYNITAEALLGAQVGTYDANTDAWTRPPQWEMHLISVLKSAFGCDVVLRLGDSDFRKLTRVCYIGLKHQAQLAAYAHEVLRRQVVKARAAYTATLPSYYTRGEKIAAGESFCVGYISNIRKQVTELSVTPEHAAAILRIKSEVLGGVGHKYQGTNRGHDGAALSAGRAAGVGASLHRPMNGGAVQLKLNA